jgi:putative hydrolase of HD superfamily
MTSDLHRLVRFAYEMGHLRRTHRSGWNMPNIPNPESVASHSARVGMLAFCIAVQEDANPDRAAALGLFHDCHETRVGDRNSVTREYIETAAPHDVVVDQVDGLPPYLAARILGLVDEHAAAKTDDGTPEAACSRDADQLDCLLTAREYQAAGNQLVQPWIESGLRGVRTATGQALANIAVTASPGEWFMGFASQYGLPRAVGQ